ncbi:GNAT family N-acetyltransferase [Rhizobiales bacterium]|uniref:GNAT family N-acetyltransferase n=1 Tax=Hongsoonwoonella zoysiae TaxID=2821844 RepID=UPI0015609682|nr:GNAT family N-acetyltransferase [Hongsoonwoonella zoysiae]NRG19619.1 GNAT family N-acetyltransferase [Hongsoonwoonella zoysiae]
MNIPEFAIDTERLHLRLARLEDAEALAGLITPGISRWVAAWPYPTTVEIARSLISSRLDSAADVRIWPMVITARAEGGIIGWLGLEQSESDAGVLELGYWIAENAQGKGYAFEAASASVDTAFSRLGANAVEAGAQPENAVSHHLLKKLGMKEAGERLVYAPSRNRHENCRFWRKDKPA